MNNTYTYLTQIMRPAAAAPARNRSGMRAALPGQIDCVLARGGTFADNDACLAVTSCGYRWGFDAAVDHVCKRVQGGTFGSQTECQNTLYACDPVQGTCSQSSTGTFATADECKSKCIMISQLYRVNMNKWDFRDGEGAPTDLNGTADMVFPDPRGTKVFNLGFVDTSNATPGQSLRWIANIRGQLKPWLYGTDSFCLGGVIVDTEVFQNKLNSSLGWTDTIGTGPWTPGTWGRYFSAGPGVPYGDSPPPSSLMAKLLAIVGEDKDPSRVVLVGDIKIMASTEEGYGCDYINLNGSVDFNSVAEESSRKGVFSAPIMKFGPRAYFAFMWINMSTASGSTLTLDSVGENSIKFI